MPKDTLLGPRTADFFSALHQHCLWLVERWSSALEQREFERSIAVAGRLADCVRCMTSIASEASACLPETDGEYKLPRAPSEPAAFPADAAVKFAIQNAYPAEEREELRRAFSDLRETLGVLCSCLIPEFEHWLRIEGKLTDAGAAALAWELERELEHVEYHLANDIVSSCNVAPSWV